MPGQRYKDFGTQTTGEINLLVMEIRLNQLEQEIISLKEINIKMKKMLKEYQDTVVKLEHTYTQ